MQTTDEERPIMADAEPAPNGAERGPEANGKR
jgi:hypothetical protein